MAIYKSKFTGQEIDDILTNASNVTNIEANPSGEATEELTKITIGDTTYSIPEGTEGTEGTVVEGNPSGDATVELTKLKIGDTIYSIPQGGGGASLYKHSISLATPFSPNNDVFYFVDNNSTPYTVLNVPITAFMCRFLDDFNSSPRPTPTSYSNVFVFLDYNISTPAIKAYYLNSSGNLTPFVYNGSFEFSDTVTPL